MANRSKNLYFDNDRFMELFVAWEAKDKSRECKEYTDLFEYCLPVVKGVLNKRGIWDAHPQFEDYYQSLCLHLPARLKSYNVVKSKPLSYLTMVLSLNSRDVFKNELQFENFHVQLDPDMDILYEIDCEEDD